LGIRLIWKNKECFFNKNILILNNFSVTTQDGVDLAKDIGLAFMETSALLDKNVD
jgi:hypothetical protein